MVGFILTCVAITVALIIGLIVGSGGALILIVADLLGRCPGSTWEARQEYFRILVDTIIKKGFPKELW